MVEQVHEIPDGKGKCWLGQVFVHFAGSDLLEDHVKKRLEQRKIQQAKDDRQDRVEDIDRKIPAVGPSIRQYPEVGIHGQQDVRAAS